MLDRVYLRLVRPVENQFKPCPGLSAQQTLDQKYDHHVINHVQLIADWLAANHSRISLDHFTCNKKRHIRFRFRLFSYEMKVPDGEVCQVTAMERYDKVAYYHVKM